MILHIDSESEVIIVETIFIYAEGGIPIKTLGKSHKTYFYLILPYHECRIEIRVARKMLSNTPSKLNQPTKLISTSINGEPYMMITCGG